MVFRNLPAYPCLGFNIAHQAAPFCITSLTPFRPSWTSSPCTDYFYHIGYLHHADRCLIVFMDLGFWYVHWCLTCIDNIPYLVWAQVPLSSPTIWMLSSHWSGSDVPCQDAFLWGCPPYPTLNCHGSSPPHIYIYHMPPQRLYNLIVQGGGKKNEELKYFLSGC